QVLQDRLHGTFGRRAVAAATAAVELERRSLRHQKSRGLAEVRLGAVWHPERGPVRPSLAAALEAPWGVLRALDGGRDVRVLEHREVVVDARAAAVAAGTSAVGSDLQLLDQPGLARLPDLDRRESRCRLRDMQHHAAV